MSWRVFLFMLVFFLNSLRADDNLREFSVPMALPFCGAATDNPSGVIPFATCRTLIGGFSINAKYSNKGVDALAKLIEAISVTGQSRDRFESLAAEPLTCELIPKPGTYIEPPPPAPGSGENPSVGIGSPPPPPPPPQGMPSLPCKEDDISSYLSNYNNRPDVQAYRQFEQMINLLDLTDVNDVLKIKKATVIIQATGSSITFSEINALLQ
ncbi:hypothetical protein QVH39_12600 [Enterobacter pseudoroggenkampii]|uniref:hypothetical protein n=1 Tax=Enterobacter pseudoroggenkampii TaxID=2996112 RepID=UPI000AC9191D|nr:hypothetical protein [Enterobacter pseudoroggenkampii]WJW84119.1 hypothetical protein QVH39_12600 [Enterobacter pseudoroggenkampii]